MKLLSNKSLMFLVIVLAGAEFISSCTHKNDVVLPPAVTGPVITRGVNIHLPGSMTAGNATEWKFDKYHSSVLWQSNYSGASGLLTGRFNMFGMSEVTDAKAINYIAVGTSQPLLDSSWAFYENEPAKTYFNGYVQINTSNTGEPGRDAGCNVSGMGTTAIVAGTHNLSYPNLAKIKSTEVKFDPLTNGYIVKLNLTYQGKLAAPLTKPIVGKLVYIPKAAVQFGTSAGFNVFGLQLSFQFNCRDFGIISTSISDKIEIQCNMNFNNK